MLDYLIVGAGPYGCTFGRIATDAGKSVKIIDRRSHIAGNTYTEDVEGVLVHKYGAHIFHTNDERIWRFVNQFARFQRYHHKVKAMAGGKMYTLPINLETFNQVYDIDTPQQALTVLEDRRVQFDHHPRNFEEAALSHLGPELYELFFKGYTMRQWNRDPKDVPASVFRRLPIRTSWDDHYFDDDYCGIPSGGYTKLFDEMTKGIPIELNVDFLKAPRDYCGEAKTVVFTGPIDEYFGYKHGRLEYRGLKFDTQVIDEPDYQGCAVVNHCDHDVAYTRVIEHRHFDRECKSEKTVVTWEYPHTPVPGDEVYYPIADEPNKAKLAEYQKLAAKEPNTIFGGRLAEYKYYDMHQVIASAALRASKLGLGGFMEKK